MKVAIFGASGQLGRDVVSEFSGHDAIAVTHDRADIRRAEAVESVVREEHPEWVINCAAMTHVDACETATLDAFEINALGARHVARAAAAHGAQLVHISTDYVFDGSKSTPYVESDMPRPINAYGISKLAGEYFARAECAAHAIVRTSGLSRNESVPRQGNEFRGNDPRARARRVVRCVSSPTNA